MLWSWVLPVELARLGLVVETGGAVDAACGGKVEMEGSVKLVQRGILSEAFLNILGIERRFSSIVDEGDAERGESMSDMERLLGGREKAEVTAGVPNGDVEESCSEEKTCWYAIQTPETTIKRRSASSVSIGRVAFAFSRKEFASMLEGVMAIGVTGVGGDVAEGIE